MVRIDRLYRLVESRCVLLFVKLTQRLLVLCGYGGLGRVNIGGGGCCDVPRGGQSAQAAVVKGRNRIIDKCLLCRRRCAKRKDGLYFLGGDNLVVLIAH